VTPHINAGGLVTLDVQAEVSVPGNPATPNDAPPISTRSVQTLVAVPSGRTMVMGGLIRENKTNSTSGLPLLARIPILGAAFGSQEFKNDRTELVLFITPRVIETDSDNEAIINDLRRRMQNLDRTFPGTSTWPASPPSYEDRAIRALDPSRFDLPRPVEPRVLPQPAGQPLQTPEAGQPASAATPIPGQAKPVPVTPSGPPKPAAPAPATPVPPGATLPRPAPAPAPAAPQPTPAPAPAPAPAAAPAPAPAAAPAPAPTPPAPSPGGG
jgi:hypothetical protein